MDTLWRASDHLVVTGGSGWLGQSLLERLLPELEAAGTRLTILGRTNRGITIAGRTLPVVAWTDRLSGSLTPTVLVHCAFITREHMARMDQTAYQRANRALIERGVDLAREASVRAVLHTSSGAATAESPDLYGQLKQAEEVAFASLRPAVPVVTARAFSVSGHLCPKPQSFAFTSFVRDALFDGHISVRADHEVWRRYVDAGEYMEVALRSALAGHSDVVESGGELVELHDLAQRVALITGAEVHEAPLASQSAPDRYFSASNLMEWRASGWGLRLTELDDQIRATARSWRSTSPT